MSAITVIQIRRGLAAQWTSVNPVLHSGEIGLETDTFNVKYGDGVTAWNSLPYPASSGGTSDPTRVLKSGDTMTGPLVLPGNPASALQAAPKQYVDTSITNLIGGAPGALDTLKELADAIGDDANYAAGVATAIGAEASTRAGADSTLTSAIATEASTRSSAVSANATAISNEATARSNADTALSTAISDEAVLARSAEVARDMRLIPASVVTASTVAVAANTLVPLDTTSNAITATLPNAPTDGTRIALKLIIRGGTTAAPNTVTWQCAGSDVINRTGGGTVGTLSLSAQAVVLRYKASGGIWFIESDDLPLNQLDTRFDANSRIDTPALAWRGAWSTVAYAVGDVVSSGGAAYLNRTAHTGSGSIDLTKFTLLPRESRVPGLISERPSASVLTGCEWFATDDQGGTTYFSTGAAWLQLAASVTWPSGQLLAIARLTTSFDIKALGITETDISGMSIVVPATAQTVRLRFKWEGVLNDGTATANTILALQVKITDSSNNIIAVSSAQAIGTASARQHQKDAVAECHLDGPVAGGTYKLRARTVAAAPSNWTSGQIQPGYGTPGCSCDFTATTA